MNNKKNEYKKRNKKNEQLIIEKSTSKDLSNLEKIISAFENSAQFILLFITLTLILTYLLFIIKIPISKIHLPLSILISAIIFIILKKKDYKIATIGILIALLVFSSFTFVIGKIYDGTADGNTYHKLAVGAMKNGWNPVYSSVGDFNKKQGNPFNIYKDNVNINWVDHYAKGTETFAAVVYKSTGNIECGKVYNALWIYIGLFLLFGIFSQMNLNILKSFILSSILAFNPISLVQITNYYLDGVLAISLFIIILICLLQQKKMTTKEEIFNYLILGCSLIWAINTKFNGLAFTGVFCLVLYLYRHIRNFIINKNTFIKPLVKDTIFYIIAVILSVVVVGAGSYTKNFIDHGHPLHPLYGKNHIPSMIMMEIPKSMQKYSPLKAFTISIFAKGENVAPSYADYVNEPDLKIPLTTSKEEINNYSVPDIRMGGFGPLFSTIFIITVIFTIIILIKLLRKKDYDRLIPYLIVLLTIFLLIALIDGSYWARYIPYLYLTPVFVLLHYFQNGSNNKIIKFILIITVAFVYINFSLILMTQIISTKNSNEYIKIRENRFKDYAKTHKKVNINLAHHGIQGIQYNLDDWNVDNYILTDNKNLKNDCYMFSY